MINDTLDQNYINFLKNGELGENSLLMVDLVNQDPGNSIYVDLGVESGKSSKLLLHRAIEKNNKVFGIDPVPAISIPGILDHPNYTYIAGDSVSVGSTWTHGRPKIVFVDSVHAQEQVLRELYYWWDLLVVGGFLVFHDTNWQGYIHKFDHPCAGRGAGTSGKGYDVYAGRAWETPDKAIKAFFHINGLQGENDVIKIDHFPDSLGMTYLQKKKEFNYNVLIPNWAEIETNRQILLACFK